ncbi:780_t:CDS:2, partial [Racocetra persica]
VERATLDAALENQLKIEGYCLPERKAEDGTLPKQYSLKELDPNLYSESNTALYSIRNEENFKLAEKMLVLNISNIKFDNEKLPVIEGKETKIIHLEENFEDNKNKIQLITKWIKSQNVQKLFITDSWCDTFRYTVKREEEISIKNAFISADKKGSGSSSSLQTYSNDKYTSKLLDGIYTSKLIDFQDLPKPKNSDKLLELIQETQELTNMQDFEISSDEEKYNNEL